MHWDETSLFIHSNLAETSTQSRSTPNPRYVLKRGTSMQQDEQAQETQGFVTRVQPHTLRSTSLLTVYFGTPNMFLTLWFGFVYGTNPPLGTLII
jgi:hypothetical protein